MRVTLVIPELGGGGAERVFSTLLSRWDPSDTLSLVTIKDAESDWYPVPPNVQVIHLGARSLASGLVQLVRALRRLRPEVVLSTQTHLNGILGWIRVLVPGPSFWGRESGVPSQTSLQRMQWREALYRNGYRRLDGVIAPSRAVFRELVELYRLTPARVAVIPNPLDLDQIERDATEEPSEPFQRFFSGAPAETILVAAVGRLELIKGFDELIEVASLIPKHFRFVIVGEGSQRAALERRVADLRLGDRVFLGGYDPHPARIVARCHYSISTSHSEGFPNAVLESLALGVPVIGYSCPGGLAEIIEDGHNGILVSMRHPASLAAALKDVPRIRWDRAAIRLKVRERYEADKIVSRYQHCLSEGRSHG